MHPVLQKLAGDDRRSTGRADEIAEEIVEDPSLADPVIDGMFGGDAVVQMRAADALEKATRERPDLLAPYKNCLLSEAQDAQRQEVRWHLAQMLPRLPLVEADRTRAIAILEGFLDDDSKIVKTNAMQALSDLAKQDQGLRPEVVPLRKRLAREGSASMKARGRKLLERLGPEP